MFDVAQFETGARAGRRFASEQATTVQLRSLQAFQDLVDNEIFAASMIADEVYFALHPDHQDDHQASWEFWQGIGGELVSREFVVGFVDGAVSIISV